MSLYIDMKMIRPLKVYDAFCPCSPSSGLRGEAGPLGVQGKSATRRRLSSSVVELTILCGLYESSHLSPRLLQIVDAEIQHRIAEESPWGFCPIPIVLSDRERGSHGIFFVSRAEACPAPCRKLLGISGYA